MNLIESAASHAAHLVGQGVKLSVAIEHAALRYGVARSDVRAAYESSLDFPRHGGDPEDF